MGYPLLCHRYKDQLATVDASIQLSELLNSLMEIVSDSDLPSMSTEMMCGHKPSSIQTR